MQKFIVSRGGREQFYDLDELRALARRGQLGAGDLVYHPLLGRRLYAREVEEIRQDMADGAKLGLAAAPEEPPRRSGLAFIALGVCIGGIGLFAAFRARHVPAPVVVPAPVIAPTTPMAEDPATSAFDRSCSDGDARGCASLGYLYATGEKVPLDYARAAAYDERACRADSGQGCGNLAKLYRTGRGVAKDVALSMKYTKRGCDLKWPPACYELAVSYANGDGVEKDPARALPLYKMSCEAAEDGDPDACNNLGYMYYAGTGTGKSDTLAVSYYDKGCRNGSPRGCGNLAFMHGRGNGVPANTVRGLALAQLACDGGDATTCNDIDAIVRGTRATKPGARTLAGATVAAMLRACAQGDASQCAELGMLSKHGYFMKASEDRADEYLTKACDLEHQVACAL